MNKKRGRVVFRPLGLTLAIFSAVVLFSGWPLVKFYIAWRLNKGLEDSNGILYGSTIPFDILTILTGIMGVVVLVTAIFAWRGKPPQTRFAFMAAVFVTTIALIAETALRSTTKGEPGELVLNSGGEALKNVLQCQVPLQIMVALYIIWYCNRAPARAFYRQEPLMNWQQKQEDTTS